MNLVLFGSQRWKALPVLGGSECVRQIGGLQRGYVAAAPKRGKQNKAQITTQLLSLNEELYTIELELKEGDGGGQKSKLPTPARQCP